MLTLMTDLSGASLGFSATGMVTAEDYEQILIPIVTDRLDGYGKVRLLLHFGEDFEGYSLGAAWDDAKFGVTHIGHFEKLAAVSDTAWIRSAAKVIAPFVRCPVQVFHDAELEPAKQWITTAAE